MKNETRRFLVVSFHDLTPDTRTSCEAFMRDANARGVRRLSLLVVPEPAGGKPMNSDPSFIRWLREKAAEGHELCLHGLGHRDIGPPRGGLVSRWIANVYTEREGEFFRIDQEEATARIERGLAAFRDAHLPVSGFVPPAWLMNAEGRGAAARAGLRYVTGLCSMHLLENDRRIYAPTIVLSCRSAARRAVSRLWARLWSAANRTAQYLRIAVHPVDLDHPGPYRTLLNVMQAASSRRTTVTYDCLLQRIEPRPGEPPS
ncbi:MAG: DUF2334 domain-containing protein [Lentisphaerae bacterium]|nr:DUF2334 domain-containing protein [Lentisphaerota bacterium]